MDAPEYQPLAQIEFDEVVPDQRGFTLTGSGPDGAQYRLNLHFELPLDARTRAVLGGLLTQAGLLVTRRRPPGESPSQARRRDGAHQR